MADWIPVSTHSRPKAAGSRSSNSIPSRRSFNTQPPEGGWLNRSYDSFLNTGFNTQPPEGGWAMIP